MLIVLQDKVVIFQAIRERQCTHIYCASGGNAGLATAYVCQKLNMPCTIVLPESTPSFAADKLRELVGIIFILSWEIQVAFPQGKPAATELCCPSKGACWVI